MRRNAGIVQILLQVGCPVMNASSSAAGGVARQPVLAFMVISLGVGFVTAAIPPIVDSEILPFSLPLQGLVSGALGSVATARSSPSRRHEPRGRQVRLINVQLLEERQGVVD
jgi:hypothetical protein